MYQKVLKTSLLILNNNTLFFYMYDNFLYCHTYNYVLVIVSQSMQYDNSFLNQQYNKSTFFKQKRQPSKRLLLQNTKIFVPLHRLLSNSIYKTKANEMKINLVSFKFADSELSKLASQIRHTVFVEEQGVPTEIETDSYDTTAQHYLAYVAQQPAATARWRVTENGIKLERFAVVHQFRNKGIGEQILKQIIADTDNYMKPRYLHAQNNAVNFYLRNGFIKVGESFNEADIVHYKMFYKNDL